jgi:hypothetical protein
MTQIGIKVKIKEQSNFTNKCYLKAQSLMVILSALAGEQAVNVTFVHVLLVADVRKCSAQKMQCHTV